MNRHRGDTLAGYAGWVCRDQENQNVRGVMEGGKGPGREPCKVAVCDPGQVRLT